MKNTPTKITGATARRHGFASISRSFWLLPALLLSLTGCQKPAARLTPAQRELNAKSFDVVWETIRDRHFDPTLGGLDWPAVRDELRPRAAQATTMAAARGAMMEMIGRLKLTHFGIIPPEVYEASQAAGESQSAQAAPQTQPAAHEGKSEGRPGFDLRVFGGQALVTSVEPGSPAAMAGVKPGWRIDRIAGQPVAPLIARVTKGYEDSTLLELRLQRSLLGRLERAAGESVDVVFADEHDQTRKIAVRNVAPVGRPSKLGNLPTMYVNIEDRELPGGVAYISLNAWFDPAYVMPAFEALMKKYAHAPGMILDLRGNPGGVGGMSMGMAGWLVRDEKHDLGVMKTRDSALNFVIYPRPTGYDGPLAILIDGCSASTSEIFVGGLKDLGRARLFGRRTAGAALPSIVDRLPNGDGFQFAFADFFRPNGERLEGVGVKPHVEITPTRAQLLAGHDPVLDAAAEWLATQRNTVAGI